MKILFSNDIKKETWHAFVQSSSTGTWFQTPSAFDFFQSQPSLFQPFVFGVENEGKLRGVCCGYVTVEKSAVKQFFTRRAIIIGGPCIADDATDEEVTALLEAVKTKTRYLGPIYIETRNFNEYSRWKGAFEKAGFSYHPHLNFHIDCSSAETIEAHLSDLRKRQIRKAIRNGATIVEADTEQEVCDWYNILAPLYRQKVKTPLFPLSFFLEFYRQRKGKYLLVKHEGKVIGGMMCPILEGRTIYEWFICGKDAENKEQYPSVMATWAAMEYANRHGLVRFDVMGAGEPGVPYGVRDFKAEFGGELVEHGRWLCVQHPLLYNVGKFGVYLLKKLS